MKLKYFSLSVTSVLLLIATRVMAIAPEARAESLGRQILVKGKQGNTGIISSGNFVTLSPGYSTKGTASIIKENGNTYLEFDEAFSTTSRISNVRVMLHRNSHTSGKIKVKEYISLAPLQKSHGKQRYLLPPELKVKQYGSVVIWCDRLNLTLGYAIL